MEVYQIISLIVLIVIIIYSAVLSVIYYVRSYKSKKIDASNKSGKEIVSSILDKYNLKDINVEKIDGSNRYFYTEDTIFLSKDIYEGKSIYDVAVSSYLVSSFIKSNDSKYLIRILSNLYSFLDYTILFSYAIVILGLSFEISNLVWIGVYLLIFVFISNLLLYIKERKLISDTVNMLRHEEIIDTTIKEKTTKMLFSIVSLSVASLVFKVTSFFQKTVYIIINDEE
ncbi:MAG: zinc metallopeptidase [Bacilli bacterium]|jgi:Zn-dependent membrane protease YugP|nr:zinc metallopeptidase [Bacilli bacterium]